MATASSSIEVLKSSKEKTNYIRLARLLMCGGTKGVRGVFDSKILPSQLPTKLTEPTVVSKLQQMKTRRILTSPQWNVLFPSPTTYGTSESFDITLLFKLLREFCGLPAPPKGWDDLPDDKDISLSDDLARIKYYRNELCHAKEDLGISDGDFKTYSKRIKDALLRMVQPLTSLGPLKDWEDEIDKLLTGPVTEEDERNIEELKSWYLQEMEVKEMLQGLPDAIVGRLKEEKLLSRDRRNYNYGERCVEFLKDFNSRGEWTLLLPFPWMEGDRFHIDKLYTSLTITEKGHEEKTIEVANLFSPSECDTGRTQHVRRVLIEGEAGIGKSTFCKKITYDWSKDKLTIPDVDLVLVIKCCDLKNGDLWQAIKEQNLPEDLHAPEKAEQVFDYIRGKKQRVLVIVDGFDEIPATTEAKMRQSIKSLVHGQLLSDARVILTSRPERCSDIRKHFDRMLEVRGFSWNDSSDFIKRFCSSPQNAAQTILSLKKTAAIKELTRCPLNVAFLCLVLDEKEDYGGFLKSLDISSLYFEMVFCVIKRYCVEKKERKDVQDDTLMDEYYKILVVLGEIAFDLMKDNLATFGEEKLPDDSKQILRDIGFLTESKIVNTIRPKSTYMFSHSSIKEYFAALYVAECLRKGNTDILTSIHKFTENPSASSIVNSNYVQNVYYSLQRFNLAAMVNLSSSEDYIKLINGLAARLPDDIDVTQAELFRFDFTFSFICELIGNCQVDRATVIKQIAIPDLPVVLYLYNWKQALDGFDSLFSQKPSTVQLKILRLEGLQAVSSVGDFCKIPHIVEKCRFLETLYLSFLSNEKYFSLFFLKSYFRSTCIKNLGLPYFPNTPLGRGNIFTILMAFPNLSFLDLSSSSICKSTQLWCEASPRETCPLKVLKLSHCNLSLRDVDSVLRFLRNSTTLKELDLSGNDFSGGISFDLKGTTVQVLRMSNCNLRFENVDSILSFLCTTNNLEELDLSANDFSGGIFLDLEGTTVQVLRMSHCNLRSHDVNNLLRSLCKSTTLKELDLSGNDFSGGISFDLEGIGSTIQVLRMSDCNTIPHDVHVDCLLYSLYQLTNLRELDFSGNAMDSDSKSILAGCLPGVNILF